MRIRQRTFSEYLSGVDASSPPLPTQHPAPNNVPAASSSAALPDPRQPGFWNTVFGGTQPFASGPAQHPPTFSFAAPAMPMPSAGSISGVGTSNGYPPASYSHGPHQQQQQRNGHDLGERSISASTQEHDTSPELATRKSASSSVPQMSNNGGNAGTRKTRKRQQTSCSECHRRKQKCNQVSCNPLRE